MVARNGFDKCLRVNCSNSPWLKIWCTHCFDYGYASRCRKLMFRLISVLLKWSLTASTPGVRITSIVQLVAHVFFIFSISSTVILHDHDQNITAPQSPRVTPTSSLILFLTTTARILCAAAGWPHTNLWKCSGTRPAHLKRKAPPHLPSIHPNEWLNYLYIRLWSRGHMSGENGRRAAVSISICKDAVMWRHGFISQCSRKLL